MDGRTFSMGIIECKMVHFIRFDIYIDSLFLQKKGIFQKVILPDNLWITGMPHGLLFLEKQPVRSCQYVIGSTGYRIGYLARYGARAGSQRRSLFIKISREPIRGQPDIPGHLELLLHSLYESFPPNKPNLKGVQGQASQNCISEYGRWCTQMETRAGFYK